MVDNAISEKVVLIPGLSGTELKKSLALKDIKCFNLRLFGMTDFALFVLMRSGVTIEEDFLSISEENALIAEALKGEDYFTITSYSDVKSIAAAIRCLRNLAGSEDEDRYISERLSSSIFKGKNDALISVYRKYIKLLEERRLVDSVSLVRRALVSGIKISAEIIILEECPLTPLDRALVDKVSDCVIVSKISDLYDIADPTVKISTIKNCYGVPNEVQTILDDIYKAKKPLDSCTVAVSNPRAYSQVFFDCSMLYDIPMTFGCGVSVTNSNPAKLLKAYYEWMTTGFFGTDALMKMIDNPAFNKTSLLKEVDLNVKKEDDDKTVETKRQLEKALFGILGDIKFTNDKEINRSKFDAFCKAFAEDGKYIPEDSKDYPEYKVKEKCIPKLKILADEFGCEAWEFIRKHSRLRFKPEKSKDYIDITIETLDTASLSSICNELQTVTNTGVPLQDAISNALSITVMKQSSEPGKIHITSIGKAVCTIRDNLYIAGLSASNYPGSNKEDYLLLDEELEEFGEAGKALTSTGKIKRNKMVLNNLVEVAASLGAQVNISYAGLNVADLKRSNASSCIYELLKASEGRDILPEELEKMVKKTGYFDPDISSIRCIGRAYINGKKIDPKAAEETDEENIKCSLDKSYSPSALNLFFDCPRRFMLKYIYGIKEPDEKDPLQSTFANEIGTLAHSIMEWSADSSPDKETFLNEAGKFFDRFIDEHPPVIKEAIGKEREEFVDMMSNAYDMDSHLPVLLKEEDVKCEHESGVKIHGFPDRVEKLASGEYRIVDYKSGRNIEHKDNDYKSCRQAIIYAYLMEKKKGYKVTECEFHYIRFGKIVRCAYNDDMKKQLDADLKLFKKTMETGAFLCASTSASNCSNKYCKFADICGKENETIKWRDVYGKSEK